MPPAGSYRAVGPPQERRQVTTTAIFNRPGAGVERGAEQRREQFGGVVVHKMGVRPEDRPGQVWRLAQVDANQRLGDAHEEGRRHALAADVADAERDAPVGERY